MSVQQLSVQFMLR